MAVLKVHGGEARGRRLTAPSNIRPTKGLVVEAIFNLLGDRVLESEVVDICAGSGALGIEALSRGADQAIFVEQNPEAAAIISKNLEQLDYADRAQVICREAVRWLAKLEELNVATRLWLIDPPYNQPVLTDILLRLDKLISAGAVVVEHAIEQALPNLENLTAVRERRYGDTQITILVP